MPSILSKEIIQSQKFAKIFSSILVVSFAISVIASFMLATHDQKGSSAYATLQLVSLFATFFQIAATFAVTIPQNDMYWIKPKKTPDERQIQVRRRVFEKSYKILAFGTVATFYTLAYADNFTLKASDSSRFFPFFSIMFFIYALPSVLAAWEKDS